MKKKNLSKIELLELEIERKKRKQKEIEIKKDENKLGEAGSKLIDFSFRPGCCVTYALSSPFVLMIGLILGNVSMLAFHATVPLMILWWPALFPVAGVLKLAGKIQQKRLSKKISKNYVKTSELENLIRKEKRLSKEKIFDCDLESVCLSDEETIQSVKDKYVDAKAELKQKLKEAKKKAKVLKKIEVLKKSYAKLGGKLKAVEQKCENKSKSSEVSNKEREL